MQVFDNFKELSYNIKSNYENENFTLVDLTNANNSSQSSDFSSASSKGFYLSVEYSCIIQSKYILIMLCRLYVFMTGAVLQLDSLFMMFLMLSQ